MKFLFGGITEQCINRVHVNQDKFGAVIAFNKNGDEIITAVVCDGISRSYRSELASYNTVLRILRWAESYFPKINGFDNNTIAEQLDMELRQCNRMLNHFADQNSCDDDTCCTVSGIVSDGKQLIVFNAGDSRIYEIGSSKNIRKLTVDHKGSDGRSISMFIGGMEDQDLSISYYGEKYNSSSVYLLCTDGMYNRCDFSHWADILAKAVSREQIINILNDMRKEVQNAGELDDITAVAITAAKRKGR